MYTTVSIRPETLESLRAYRNISESDSYDEAIQLLLIDVEFSREEVE